jgi:membrane protein YdbS with pleckstrin-like domain
MSEANKSGWSVETYRWMAFRREWRRDTIRRALIWLASVAAIVSVSLFVLDTRCWQIVAICALGVLTVVAYSINEEYGDLRRYNERMASDDTVRDRLMLSWQTPRVHMRLLLVGAVGVATYLWFPGLDPRASWHMLQSMNVALLVVWGIRLVVRARLHRSLRSSKSE